MPCSEWFTFSIAAKMPDTYFITLRPLAPAYFGGEHGPVEEDYFLRTRLFPQQTAVLGMLRYELLKRNAGLRYATGRGFSIDDPDVASKLIGASSFSGDEKQTFGKIQQLSPVFLRYDNTAWFLIKDPAGFAPAAIPGRACTASGEESATLRYLPGYNAKKDHLSEIFASAEGDRLRVFKGDADSLSDAWAFHLSVKIGITKQYKQQPKDDGFFKMELLHLHPRAAYGCYACLDAGHGLPRAGSGLVYLGGNRTPFQMKFTQASDFFPEGAAFALPGVAVLLSDAYAEGRSGDAAALEVSDSIIFRNQKTETAQTRSFHQKPLGDHAHTPRLLLARGGLFFEPNPTALHAWLDHPAYARIGYNAYSLPQPQN